MVSKTFELPTCKERRLFSVYYYYCFNFNNLGFLKRLSLAGAKEMVVYLTDIDHSKAPQHIHSNSDVFTILQKGVRVPVPPFLMILRKDE
jgi:hypothetical protein